MVHLITLEHINFFIFFFQIERVSDGFTKKIKISTTISNFKSKSFTNNWLKYKFKFTNKMYRSSRNIHDILILNLFTEKCFHYIFSLKMIKYV